MLKEESKREGPEDDSDDDDVGSLKSSKRKRPVESDCEEESDSEGESDESDDDEDTDGGEEGDDVSDGDGEEIGSGDDGSDGEEEEEEGKEESDVTDSEEYDTEDDSHPTTTRRTRRTAILQDDSLSDDSTSDESRGDPCPICLGRMKGEIGSPEACDHSFCLECILEWAKTNNSCPQDRIPFFLVFARYEIGGPIIKRIPIEESKPDDIPDEEEEDPTFCEVCGRCDREDVLLLCDGCDLGYHLECLDPPLDRVPIDEWFCPDCQAVNSTAAAAEVDVEDGELHDLLDDGAPSSSLPTLRPSRKSNRASEEPRRVRLLPRTRATERVRARITRSRRERARPTITREQEQQYEAVIDAVAVASGTDNHEWPMPSIRSSISKPRRSTKPPKRKKRKPGPRKKRKVKGRKTTKKRTVLKTRKTKGSKKRKAGKTTRGKRKTKKKRKVSKKVKTPMPAMTPKSRLAEVLGIRPCKPWQLIPTMQPSNAKEQLNGRRDNAALPNLSLLGVNAEVDISMENDDYGDAILTAGVRSSSVTSSQAIARRKALSVRAQMSHTSIRARVERPVPVESVSSEITSNLLDSILENQSRLMKSDFDRNRYSFPFKAPLSKGFGKLGNSSLKLNENVQGRSRAAGPDSPGSQQSGGESQSSTQQQQQPQQHQQQHQSSGYVAQEGGASPQSGGGNRGQNNDPTGSKAYALYLRKSIDEKEDSPESDIGVGSCNGSEKDKKYSEKKKNEDEEVDLYSDIEPSVPEGEDDDDDDDDDDEEGEGIDNVSYSGTLPSNMSSEARTRENERDPESSGDELVIDDSDKPQVRETLDNAPHRTVQMAEEPENNNIVGSSNLPGLNDFELEAVSDTDTPELEKSANSSISLSDVGDHEVTSSTNENPNPSKSEHLVTEIFGESDEEKNRERNAQPIVGLEGLETETISDNEEISFDDNDDNIEEGEIPSEMPRHATPPNNRPRVNLEIRRVIEVAQSPRDQEGEYEEGEIVDDNAKRKEKKKDKKEKVNKKLEDEEHEDDEEEEGHEEGKEGVEEFEKDKENVMPPEVETEPEKEQEETIIPVAVPPEIPKSPPPKKIKAKQKEKEKEKEKEKDVSFKKVSKSTKERNYRENEKEDQEKDKKDNKNNRDRSRNRRDVSRDRRDRDRGDRNDRNKDSNRRRERDREKRKEPKRKEMERYNVRKMITQKEEERKKKDEFGRDVALRSRSRSRSRRRTRSRSRRRSRSRSRRRSGSRSRKVRRSYSRSPSRSRNKKRGGRRRSYSSSSSSSYTSSSTSSSSSSSSRSRSRGHSRNSRRRKTRSRSRTPLKKKPEKKKVVAAPPPATAVGTVPGPGGAPAKSKEKAKEKPKKSNPVVEKKKEKKKHEKRKGREVDKREETRLERERKKKRREKSPLQSKEVYQAGGSIMVSVSFAKRAPGKENKDAKRRKERDVKMEGFKKVRKPGEKPHGSPIRSWSRSRTPSGKRTPLQDEPMWSPDHLSEARMAEKPIKSPEVIDLDVIMVTPPPQEPILISDSEDEGITRLPPDLGTTPAPPVRPQGPKTPPEPAVKFTLSSKQVLKPINNPLRDEEEEEEEEPPAPARGPNTPPGPPPESDESVGRAKSPSGRVPRSPAGSPPGSSPEPDVYDPFEPTKSPSPPGSPQQEARVSSSDQTETTEKGSPEAPAPKAASPPPLPTEPPEPEERPPEPQKPPEEEATSTVPAAAASPVSAAVTTTTSTKTSKVSKTVAPPKPVVPNTTAPVAAAPVNPITQIFPGLPANVANILYPAALAAAVRNAGGAVVRPQVVQTVVAPDFSRPPPAANILNRPPPMTIIAPTRIGEKTRASQNGRDVTHTDVIDMDLDSPNSPDSSDVSDIFEPPSPHSTHQAEKPSPKKTRSQTKTTPMKAGKGGAVDKFDSLFGSGPRQSRKHSTPHKHKHGKKIKVPGKKGEGNDEDIPNSAVDLQVKEKFLKKVQRQERVVEEVKLSLKPFYNKKTITKEDYKDIMRKCVQKVCHNKSGEINPTKIRGLVQGYIKKVKYYKKKMNGPSEQVPGKPTPSEPPPPGFALITKAAKPPTPIKSKA